MEPVAGPIWRVKMREELQRFARRRKLLNNSEEVIELIFKNQDLPFSLWAKTTYPRSVNIFCKVNCIVCNSESRISTKHLAKRTLVKEEVCLKCGSLEIYKREEWRDANSKAQKKIQSTPEQKRKNALGVSKFWRENPEKLEQMRQTMLSKYENPEYKEKVAKARGKNSHALSGEYTFKDGRVIEFGSSYELCFLIWLENQPQYKIVRKCKFYIKYNHNGRLRYYYPDYVLISDTKKMIVEIKSVVPHYYDESKNAAKVEAAEKFIKENNFDSYWFIDEAEAEQIGLLLKRSTKIKPLCKELHSESRIKLFSNKKELQYIGRIQ